MRPVPIPPNITTLPNHWVFCSTEDEGIYTDKLNSKQYSLSELSDEAIERFALYFEQDYAKQTKETCEWVVEHLCFADENKDLVKKIITGQIYRTAHDKDEGEDEDRVHIQRLKRKAQGQKDSATTPPPNSIFFDSTNGDLIHKDVLELLDEKLKFDFNIQEHKKSKDKCREKVSEISPIAFTKIRQDLPEAFSRPSKYFWRPVTGGETPHQTFETSFNNLFSGSLEHSTDLSRPLKVF